MRTEKIYIEAKALVSDHFSGVGHYVQGITEAIDRFVALPEHAQLQLHANKRFQNILFVPANRLDRLGKFRLTNMRSKGFPFPARIIDKSLNHNLFLPLDLWFGRGTYLFTNFSRWPLWRAKSATIVYDISFEVVPQFADANNRRFLSAMVRKSVKKSDLIVTISQHAKKELVEFYNLDPKNVLVAYPGIDRSVYYKRSTGEIDIIKEKYGLPDNFILFVGNIEPRKNIIGLIDAYLSLPVSLSKKHPLVLVGASGWLTEEIFSKVDAANKSGHVILRPNQYVADEDMPAVYSGASALVYPSHYEGFGIPPVEAMSCGVPVISADNSSLPEAVGEAGLLVKSTDTSAIANSIEKIVSDTSLRSELIEKGYAQSKKFSWDESGQLIYKAVVEL